MAVGGAPQRPWRTLLSAATDEWRATPFHRLTLRGDDPAGVLIWGRDFRVPNHARGIEILRGSWRIASERLAGVHPIPWEASTPSRHFLARLHAFSWLKDVAPLGVEGKSATKAIMQGWVSSFGDRHSPAWAPELVAERLYAWLCHGRFAFEAADAEQKALLLRSLARQARHLTFAVQEIEEPSAKIKAGAALILAGVAGIPDPQGFVELGEELIEEAAASQIMSDGGHASRSPQALYEAMCDFLTVVDALARSGSEAPRLASEALPRMAAMLRFFCLGDERLGAFNGGGEVSAEAVAALLAEAPPGRSFDYATQSGFQRLQAGDVRLLMDVGGGPQPIYGERAHAGALGFEMTAGVDRLIVNVGSDPELLPEWRAAGRATNGHSTLIIEDALSASFQQRRGRAAAHPVGPAVQHKRTEEDEGVLLETYHDGYRAQFGYLHRRRLFLSSDGREIRGQDAVAPPLAANRTQPKPASFAIRFHLHPSVQAQRADIHQISLAPANGPPWTFITNAQKLDLEPSIYLSNAVGPQRARQIVLRGESDPSQREDRAPNLVKWKLAKAG